MKKVLRSLMLVGLGLIGSACAVAGGLYLEPLLKAKREEWRADVQLLRLEGPEVMGEAARLLAENERLRTETGQQVAALEKRRQQGIYIVVDTYTNTLLVRQADQVLRQAVCSTGSGRELVAGKRRWVFNTPRGQFKVLDKRQMPVWVKPDWAFYEEGEKPPARNSPKRFEPAVLGEYALGFGDGYLIHGTLYKRLLGQSVTHGCVRLDDDDLRYVYETAPIGTQIYIY